MDARESTGTEPHRVSNSGSLPAGWMALAFLLAGAACAPALNNGFISDDFVILARVNSWIRDYHNFSWPPEGIRTIAYATFALLSKAAGYRPELFYLYAAGLHMLNIWLFGRLLMILTGRKSIAVAGMLVLASMQNPQEAVWWLSAIGDTYVGTFTLAGLLAWLNGRTWASLACYAFAMLSKESGIVFIALVPLAGWLRDGRLKWEKQYLYLLIPAAGFLGLFAALRHGNTYMSSGLYKIRPEGLLIIANSAHRLAFPWLYLALLLLWPSRWRNDRSRLAAWLLWVFAAIAPYAFITYQNHIPSRSQYLAAIGMSGLIALLLESISRAWLRFGFLAAFAVVNIGYLWMAKDRQYAERAAPTTQLLDYLRSHQPQCLRIVDFPFNPWVAKETAPLVPGWSQEMIRMDEPAAGHCRQLRWDPRTWRYIEAP
jgi:hypothetical protein